MLPYASSLPPFIVRADGSALPAAAIARGLAAPAAAGMHAPDAPLPVGALTGVQRDEWAQQRQALASHSAANVRGAIDDDWGGQALASHFAANVRGR